MCITPVGGTSRRNASRYLQDDFVKCGKCNHRYNFSESSLKVARKQNLAWAIYVAHVLNILGESDG